MSGTGDEGRSRMLVGTSGWSYPSGRGTWNGLFYPPRGARGFKPGDELAYYAEHFETVEVNATFYRPPSAPATARWARETPAGFEFSIKLHQRFTHRLPIGRDTRSPAGAVREKRLGPGLPSPTQTDIDEFRAGVEPIAVSGKLGAVLVQFPPGFHADGASRDYLAGLLRTFRDYPLAVELRHRSWSDDDRATSELLAQSDAAWVQIDEPKFRMSIRQDLAPNTPRFYYLRLHGRNAAQWWNPAAPEDRYDYLYSGSELRTIAQVAGTVAPEVRKSYLYLNNHFAAKSVVNATVLKHLLNEPVTGEYRPELVDAYPELRGIVSEEPGRLV
jgi:uncharacterized protein YecE (DUF72 family)